MTGENEMSDTKECPFCGEEIKAVAIICRYCHTALKATEKVNMGQFVKIRLKSGEKTYFGDVFIPEHLRVSDILNDSRHFIVFSNAVEERKTKDVAVGFLAINKNMTEWIELKIDEGQSSDSPTRFIYHSE
jgi:hypothetical protein